MISGGIYNTANADLITFCTSPPPKDSPAALDFYNSQCPQYLQSQINSAIISANALPSSTDLATQKSQLDIQKAQADINTAVAGLIKAPPSQVAGDLSALAISSQVKDADQTFELAKLIGIDVAGLISDKQQILFVSTATDLAALQLTPTDAVTVLQGLTTQIELVKNISCTRQPPPKFDAQSTSGDLLTAGAIASSVAAITNMFQASLVATGKTVGVTDPTQLMLAGFTSGLGTNKKQYLWVRKPDITSENSVIKTYIELRKRITAAENTLKTCPKKGDPGVTEDDPAISRGTQTLTDAKGYLNQLISTKDSATPSLLDIAVKQAAILDNHIAFVLYMQRDVSGGGIAAIKPNWFNSTKLYVDVADVITYQVSKLDGRIEMADYKKTSCKNKVKLNEWQKAFRECRGQKKDTTSDSSTSGAPGASAAPPTSPAESTTPTASTSPATPAATAP